MNAKEKRDIACNLTALMTSVLCKTASSESVANVAIEYCKTMLNTYPELRHNVDYIMSGSDTDYDTMVAWYRFEKNNLSKNNG